MSSCSSSTGAAAYQAASAQSYLQQQLSAIQRPAQQDNAVAPTGAQPLNASGRGQLLNINT